MAEDRLAAAEPPAIQEKSDHNTEQEAVSLTPSSTSSDCVSHGSNEFNADPWPELDYRNSLLAFVGWLDLTNALDFPANVWNQVPIPTFAKALMGLGGGIALLATIYAWWDTHRSWKNIKFLRQERQYLEQKRRNKRALRVEEAWLSVSFREIGWESVDRTLLDVSMAISGILVGIGTLLAIRGDIKAAYDASNILSGYLGNSFPAAYGLFSTGWSVFMARRAWRHSAAIAAHKHQISPELQPHFHKLHRRHLIYAISNGLAAIVSGVGSLISAKHWPGYVVLIPSIIGSVFNNYYWRHYLGYGRFSIKRRVSLETFDILERISVAIAIRSAFTEGRAETTNFCDIISQGGEKSSDTILEFLHENGLYGAFCQILDKDGINVEKIPRARRLPINDESRQSEKTLNLETSSPDVEEPIEHSQKEIHTSAEAPEIEQKSAIEETQAIDSDARTDADEQEDTVKATQDDKAPDYEETGEGASRNIDEKTIQKYPSADGQQALRSKWINAANLCIRNAGSIRYRDEARFLLELYGYYLDV